MKLALSLSFSAVLARLGAPSDTIAPLLTDLATSGDSLSFNTDEGGTAYWLVDSTASYVDCDALIAAQASGDASGNFAAASGSVSQDIDLSGVTNGDYKLHVGMLDAAGNASNVLTTDITIAIPAAVMGSDASALFWWAPDSVTASGGSVTAVADKTANGHDLDTIPTGGAAPTFDGSKMSFDGTNQCIVASTASGPIQPVLAGGGSVAIFMVVDLFSPANSGESLSDTRRSFGEFYNAAGNNRSTSIGHTITATTQVYEARSQQFSAAFNISYNAVPFQKSVLCVVITQTTATIYLDNVEVASGAVTAANFPADPGYLALGALAVPSGLLSGSAVKGDIFEAFATTDVTAGHISDVTAELAAKYGITLA